MTNINATEKLMYEVMKAIYDSGIPISFKGSMVLKACLIEHGYSEETRHTVDIDANWYSDTLPSAQQMVDSLQKAISKSGIDLNVSIYRMYGKGRSAGFELSDSSSGEILFTMDIDVNRPVSPTRIYEIGEVRFCGVAPIQMIADKTMVISTDKVFRRIKDVVDLYYLSNVFAFDPESVLSALKNSERELGDFNGFLYRSDELHHSYDKFRFSGSVYKPPFEEIYDAVKAYIRAILPK
ncbi:MAG: nucleotidyl transferase AbiEii/AbiGii toxin family protein [Erysipelotrichaceae bacterium]|nr:nucleotidyl transferase AbiEii/AbiGii toxin family protein [Erysipelotrichaceae bacterium]